MAFPQHNSLKNALKSTAGVFGRSRMLINENHHQFRKSRLELHEREIGSSLLILDLKDDKL